VPPSGSAKIIGIGGFPHSEIRGSKVAHTSPRLIAACHVLHRLYMPRHPRIALTSRLNRVPSKYYFGGCPRTHTTSITAAAWKHTQPDITTHRRQGDRAPDPAARGFPPEHRHLAASISRTHSQCQRGGRNLHATAAVHSGTRIFIGSEIPGVPAGSAPMAAARGGGKRWCVARAISRGEAAPCGAADRAGRARFARAVVEPIGIEPMT
jgi:hypothetical protein